MNAWYSVDARSAISALGALASCGLPADRSVAMFEVRIGRPVAELAAASGDAFPALRGDPTAGLLTVTQPHRVRVHVGGEVIELRPGGYNSATSIETGRASAKGVDWSIIDAVSTDSGEQLMSRADAVALAHRWCALAAKGLGTAPKFDGVQESTMPPETGQRSPMCEIETARHSFELHLSGPKDEEVADRPDAAEFTVQLSFATKVDLP